MKSTPLFSILSLSLSLFPLLSLGFDLGSSNGNWGLTADTLDSYTSHACRTAYEASIDCSDTLLAIVASTDPDYLPSASDLDDTCTDTCRESLESYIQNVQEVCSSSYDWALMSTAAVCIECRFVKTPVENVGKLFQYKLESACTRDRYTSQSSFLPYIHRQGADGALSENDYCYLHPPHEGTDFECSDTCSVDYYKTARAHNPISELKFSHLWLVEESNYWKRDFENGYKRALECEPE